jgi:hypothetical protein
MINLNFKSLNGLSSFKIIMNKLVVPCVAWDFFSDKHINLTYQEGVHFFITFFRNYQVILLNINS